MIFRGGQFWNGNVASRAANREQRRARHLYGDLLLRRPRVRLMILRGRGRIRKRCAEYWGFLREDSQDILLALSGKISESGKFGRVRNDTIDGNDFGGDWDFIGPA